MADAVAEALARVRAKSKVPKNKEELGYFSGALLSALSAGTGEFIGAEPSKEIAKYRAENPTTGLVSEIAGLIPPSIGLSWATSGASTLPILAKIPKVGKVLEALVKADPLIPASQQIFRGSRVLARASQLATVTALEESARASLAAVIPSGNPEKVFKQALFNVPISGAIGGVLGKFQSAAIASIRSNLNKGEVVFGKNIPDWKASDPTQLKLQKAFAWLQDPVNKAKLAADPELTDAFHFGIYGRANPNTAGKQKGAKAIAKFGGYIDDIIDFIPQKGREAYVKKLLGNANEKKLIQLFNLNPKAKRGIKVTKLPRLFHKDPDVNDSNIEIWLRGLFNEDAGAKFGHIKNPRVLSPLSDAGAAEIEHVASTMTHASTTGVYTAQESVPNGLSVVLMRVAPEPGVITSATTPTSPGASKYQSLKKQQKLKQTRGLKTIPTASYKTDDGSWFRYYSDGTSARGLGKSTNTYFLTQAEADKLGQILTNSSSTVQIKRTLNRDGSFGDKLIVSSLTDTGPLARRKVTGKLGEIAISLEPKIGDQILHINGARADAQNTMKNVQLGTSVTEVKLITPAQYQANLNQKKLTDGVGGDWLLFKTDNVELFLDPSYIAYKANLSQKLTGDPQLLWGKGSLANIVHPLAQKLPLMQQAQELNRILSPDSLDVIEYTGSPFLENLGKRFDASSARAAADFFGDKLYGRLPKLGDLGKGMDEVRYALSSWFRHKAAPIYHEFNSSPRTVALANTLMAIFNHATARTVLSYGATLPTKLRGNVYGRILKGDTRARAGGLREMLEKMPAAEYDELLQAIIYNRQLAPGSLSASYKEGLEELFGVQKGEWDVLAEMTASVGVKILPEQILKPRAFPKEGFVVPIKVGTRQTRLVYGETLEVAIRNADEVVQQNRPQLGLSGNPFGQPLTYNKHEIVFRNADEIIQQGDDVLVRFDEHFQGVSGLEGSTLQMLLRGSPQHITKAQFEERVISYLDRLNKSQAKVIWEYMNHNKLTHLLRTRPEMHAQLMNRLDRMIGKPGSWTTTINKATDAVLARYMGGNSATRISQAVSEGMYAWTLGGGDVGFVAVNLSTFIQTVLPELALIDRAARGGFLERFYSYGLTRGANGAVTAYGTVNPSKIVLEGFKLMARPTRELNEALEWALEHHITQANFTREFASELDSAVGNWGPDSSLVGKLRYLMQIMGSKSEELARTHAFVVARQLGLDVLQYSEKEARLFAQEFTTRTMYAYGDAVRSKMFSGPVGGQIGLFKNWMLNFMHTMVDFSNTALGTYHQGPRTKGQMLRDLRPLLWGIAGTSVIGGPGFSPGSFMVKGAVESFSDKTMLENIYAQTGYGDQPDWAQNFTDAMYFGVPAFIGLSFSTRAEAPTSNPVRDISQLFSLAVWDRLAAMGAAGSEIIHNWHVTGAHPSANPAVFDKLMRAFAPRTMYRAMQLVGNDGIKSLNTGNQTITKLNWAEDIAYALGLGPLQVARDFEGIGELYLRDDARRERIREWGKIIAEAQKEGDWKRANIYMYQATLAGVDGESLAKSIVSNRENDYRDSFRNMGEKGERMRHIFERPERAIQNK